MAANGSSNASSHNTRNYTPLPLASPERPSTQNNNNNNSNNHYDSHNHHQSLLQSPTAAGATTRSSRKSTVSSVAASTQSTVSLQPSHVHNEGFQYRAVRTLPTWVQEYDDEDDSPSDLISPPPPLAHKEPSSRPPQKSIHDSRRENTPVTQGPVISTGSRWRAFVEDSNLRPQSRLTSNPPRPVSSQHQHQHQHQHHDEEKPGNTSGTLDWLEEGGNLNEPWLASQRKEKEGDGEGEGPKLLFVSAKRRRIWYKRLQVMLLNNPIIPLLLRSSIWILSLLALALACNIFALSTKYEFAQKPSTIMAIVVDVVAMVYLIYITYDEYSGKPLGLRSPKAKMRLIMFDLFFIIFDSANTALAFDTLFDVRWSCLAVDGDGDNSIFPNTERVNDPICRRQRALASFLFLALLSWVLTFTISVFRLVERVSRQIS